MKFKDTVDECINMDYKKKDLGDPTRTHTKWGSMSDVDSGSTGTKDKMEKNVLKQVPDRRGWPVNKEMIVDEAKKGTGGEIQKSLLKKNKVGIPED